MNRAKNYRERVRGLPAPTANFTLPSGEVFVLRRPPLQQWIEAGRMPDSFLRQMFKDEIGASAAETTEQAMNRLTEDEVLQIRDFILKAISYACVEPRLYLDSDKEAPEDALRIGDLDEADYEALKAEVQAGCPCVPVKTQTGAVSVNTLATFRPKQQGGQRLWLDESGADGENVLNASEPTASIG